MLVDQFQMQFRAEAVGHAGDVITYHLMPGGLRCLRAVRFGKTARVLHIELKQIRNSLYGLLPFGK